MKPKRILISDLTPAHPLIKRAYPTDSYYTKLANRLLEDFYSTGVDLEENTESILRYAAITLACYMEDVVADSGQWRSFSDLCQKMFGWPVPVYHDNKEEYYPDEPSMMAVRFLIWHAATEMDDIWWKPNLPEFDTLAHSAYNLLMEEFEKAPINEQLSLDIDKMLDDAYGDFYKMRIALTWCFSYCYITRSEAGEHLLDKQIENANHITHDSSMCLYYAINHCIFAYKIGPLALYPKDYLVALAHSRNKQSLSDILDAVEVFPMNTFQMKVREDGKTIDLLCTNGKTLKINRDEITLKDKELAKFDGCVASFVSFQNEWKLNGVLTPLEGCIDRWDKLVKEDSDNMPEGHTCANADWFLRLTNGRQMLFFGDWEETKDYLVSKLKFTEDGMQILNGNVEKDLPTMLFIDKDDSHNCLQFTFGFNESIKAPDNPFYDANTARKEAVEMLWNDDCVGTGAMLYMLDRGLLPDLLNDELIMQDNPIEVKAQDARFLLRYMRKERY